jgi:hypothetical protein
MIRQRTQARLSTLEARRTAISPAIVAQMAEACGVTPAELLAEAEAFARRCQGVGAVTRADRLELLAADAGISVMELEAELQAIEGGWR